MTPTQDRDERLTAIAAIAVSLERSTGVPAALTVAQWAVESAWGASPTGKANYFGIKFCPDRHTASCTVDTHEVVDGRTVAICARFADYRSLTASAADYAWLITHGAPYAAAWVLYEEDKNLDKLIGGVAKVYSTSPRYAELLTSVAHQADVGAALAAAAGSRGEAA
jgi:flagellum-specific peptidoglycan hydrolase FlgJ